MERIFSW